MKYFTSDQHIGHENILTLGAGRDFRNLEMMNQEIRTNWWNTVSVDDEVYVIGDIAMGLDLNKSLDFFRGLPGKKFFIPGNHDRIGGTQSANRNGTYTPVYEEVGFTVLPDITHLFFSTSQGEQEVVLSHYPYEERLFPQSGKDKYKKHRPKNTGLPLIHGHTHLRERFNASYPLQFHVGVDANNFAPVSETEVVEWLESLYLSNIIKPTERPKHHA